MIDKAIDVVTKESTRYFAERIVRTEKARAYMDGAMYPYAHDPDCVAFKWKLSSCHPCDDICDLYARADLWGMGEGIFPKDKLPKLPVHPNCMCRVVPIFHGSMRVTSEEPKDKTLAGGARLHHDPYRDAAPFTSWSEWGGGSPEGSQLEAVCEGVFR